MAQSLLRELEVLLLPDPDDIIVLAKCQSCPAQMNDLRVHEGAGEGIKHRGKIVQTCTDFKCNYTVYHTPAYMYGDAKWLLIRIAARRRDPRAFTDQLRNDGVVLRLAPLVPEPPPPGRFDCIGRCQTQRGTLRAGNRDLLLQGTAIPTPVPSALTQSATSMH
ncbi:hypothetical protein EW026_g6233 [Hermanssonia centrifuga]|uniref:Uncharacterized protein n=1 Tax=Hermanssonia centrifuga TaxID=98765 RepID=A0A4S4KCL1_9APHY|nr:hypothetical protein EW026_g6233 [Hermanssonia centrifuga]